MSGGAADVLGALHSDRRLLPRAAKSSRGGRSLLEVTPRPPALSSAVRVPSSCADTPAVCPRGAGRSAAPSGAPSRALGSRPHRGGSCRQVRLVASPGSRRARSRPCGAAADSAAARRCSPAPLPTTALSTADCCAGRPAPAKPWEQRAGGGAAQSPADGLPKPWERPATGAATITPASATTSALAAATSPSAVAPRPWERPAVAGAASTSYGGGYGAGYGGSMYSR